MADPKVRLDEMIAALKERDFRLTPQRLELVRLIAASQGHPTAAQLYARIKRRFPTMSQATVYKTLSLLKGLARGPFAQPCETRQRSVSFASKRRRGAESSARHGERQNRLPNQGGSPRQSAG